MGPLYSVQHNAADARIGRERGILNPEALNRAFAPGGFC
jgi:proline iminopeptidase